MNPRKLLYEIGSRLLAAIDALTGENILDSLHETIEAQRDLLAIQNTIAGHNDKIIEIQKGLTSSLEKQVGLLKQQVGLQKQQISEMQARPTSRKEKQ